MFRPNAPFFWRCNFCICVFDIFGPKTSKMVISPSRGASMRPVLATETASELPLRPLPGVVLILRPPSRDPQTPSEVSFDPSGGQFWPSSGDQFLALDRHLRLLHGTLQFLQSFSVIFTQNRPNSDIFPFDSITPEHEICIKNTSFLNNYLDLIAQ